MSEQLLRRLVVRLAHQEPELRRELLAALDDRDVAKAVGIVDRIGKALAKVNKGLPGRSESPKVRSSFGGDGTMVTVSGTYHTAWHGKEEVFYLQLEEMKRGGFQARLQLFTKPSGQAEVVRNYKSLNRIESSLLKACLTAIRKVQ